MESSAEKVAKIVIQEIPEAEYFSPEAMEVRDETIRTFLAHMEKLNRYAKPVLQEIEAFQKWIDNHLRFELDEDTQANMLHRVATEYPWASQILGMHGDRSEAVRDVTDQDLNAVSTYR